MAKSFLDQAGLPRGLRNNNPGNLVEVGINWQGKIGDDGRFTRFENIAYGLRALARDLTNDVKKGNDTITKLIYEFAPPSENNTQSYIATVSNLTGFAPDQKLTANFETLVKLIRGIITVELGSQYSNLITSADIQEGVTMAQGIKIPQSLQVGGFLFAAALLGTAVYALFTMPPMPKRIK